MPESVLGKLVKKGDNTSMGKVLHIVKETDGKFQIRKTGSAGEGAGRGDYINYENQQQLESGLRAEGCGDASIADILKQLEESDNAEIRF